MKAESSIDRLRVATPCPVSWEQMTGDNRVRFCDLCQLNVYNISELSRPEAESLIASTEGRLCARLYRRADGTVLTKDCPVGLRALRKRVSRRVAAMFAAIVSASTAVFGQQSSSQDKPAACPTQTKITRLDTTNKVVTNSIAGSVHNAVGGVVADAIITITGAKSDVVVGKVSANKDGLFESGILPPGTYSVTINGNFFFPLTLHDIVIESNQTMNMDVVLDVESPMGIVTMDLDLPAIDSKPGTTIITQDMIRRLPIN